MLCQKVCKVRSMDLSFCFNVCEVQTFSLAKKPLESSMGSNGFFINIYIYIIFFYVLIFCEYAFCRRHRANTDWIFWDTSFTYKQHVEIKVFLKKTCKRHDGSFLQLDVSPAVITAVFFQRLNGCAIVGLSLAICRWAHGGWSITN